MGESAADLAFAQDLLSGVGQVVARRMFGAAGLFAGEVMFGLIDDGRIYLRTDAALMADLQADGAVAWTYTRRKGPKAGVPQETRYWSLPDSALDNPQAACAWGRRALAAAAQITAGSGRRRSPAPGR